MVEKMSPGDVYGLEPAALADVDPELHTLGLVWGASKAKAKVQPKPAKKRHVSSLLMRLMQLAVPVAKTWCKATMSVKTP